MGEEILGSDVGISTSDGDIQFDTNQDFLYVSGRKNLRQAIIDRLKTIKGEYFVTEYGSELHKLLGEPRSLITRNRMIGFIVEALKQEPRVQSVKRLEITFSEADRRFIEVDLAVVPIDSQVPLNLVFPLFL